MNSMYQFISVVLCIVVFGSAVAVTFGMLDINKRKEDAIVADAADKASIHSQMGMEKDDKQYVQVNSNEVYGSILAIADADDGVVVYIGNARISDDDMEKIRNRKKNVVSELKRRLGADYNYRRISYYDEDLNIQSIHFERI